MEWLPVISTLLGGGLGVGSTLAADAVRFRHQRRQDFDAVRRSTYAEFLTALTRTDSALQMATLTDATPLGKPLATTLFRSQSLLAHRYQVELVASPAVAQSADKTYARLRDMRDAVAAHRLTVGHPGSAEWEKVHVPYMDAFTELRSLMRIDVQGAALNQTLRSRHLRSAVVEASAPES